MPSIFTRARTSSTKNPASSSNTPHPHASSNAPHTHPSPSTSGGVDEFGRVPSRTYGPATPSKDPTSRTSANTYATHAYTAPASDRRRVGGVGVGSGGVGYDAQYPNDGAQHTGNGRDGRQGGGGGGGPYTRNGGYGHAGHDGEGEGDGYLETSLAHLSSLGLDGTQQSQPYGTQAQHSPIIDGQAQGTQHTQHSQRNQPYGHLSAGAHVVLGLGDVRRLVEVVGGELGARGLTTPFLFSNTAIDISPPAVRRLVASFLASLGYSNGAERHSLAELHRGTFTEEATFAGPHDLGMVLRWALARVVRVQGGLETRGLIPWEAYMAWRRSEREAGYPKTHFNTFLPLLHPQLRSLLLTLLPLLARLLAHSTSSGLTPPTLSSLFGPLLFGLGAPTPPSLATAPSATEAGRGFTGCYREWLRAVNAAEHVLLAFVRWQVSQAKMELGEAPPRRLVSWIQGYPSALPALAGEDDAALERPRVGVKTRRVASVRRNVRLYSPDLVRSCASWARGPEGAALRGSRDWARICPEAKRGGGAGAGAGGERMEPRYADVYRKKLDLPTGFHPATHAHAHGLSASANSSASNTTSISASSSTTSTGSKGTASTLFDDGDFSAGLGLGFGSGEGRGAGGAPGKEEGRFRNLADMRWGEFEALGFGEADSEKLKFDLTESARSERTTKRTTLTWADFSAAGFTRTDSSLSETLQFAPPLSDTVAQWPAAKEDLHRKLKKTQQKLPPFGWDTAPVLDGREEVVEEGFVDTFCDLLYGGGWMDRAEGTFRECNWALVEFKSLPSSPESATTGDPRTSSTLLLFEEFVPLEYRAALLQQGSKPASLRTRFPSLPLGSLLSPSKKNQKQWKQASMLNGRPYVPGAVPHSPNAREAEFERMLAGGGGAITKVITLDSASRSRSSPATAQQQRAATPTKGKDESVSKRAISSPLFSASTSNIPATSSAPVSAPPPLPPAKAAEAQSPAAPRNSSSPLPSAATPTPTKTSRFRFPVGRSNRHGVMIPSEYDTVEFETRTASYSDDELNDAGLGMAGKGKGAKGGRMSRDDAWVDILVASNANRMNDQDAEFRPRGTSASTNASAGAGGQVQAPGMGSKKASHRRSDPELASQEVAQALAAVRQHPPTDDEGEDPAWALRRELAREVEPREPTPEMLQASRAGSGSDRRRTPSPLAPAPIPTPPGIEDEEVVIQPTKRRLGYFDLHPERKPLEQNTMAPYAEDSHAQYDPGQSSMYDDSIRDTIYSEGDFEPASIDGERQPDGDIEVPAFVDHTPSVPAHVHSPGSAAGLSSKTAQLIEMYRERERQQQHQAAASPIRVLPDPLATATLPDTSPLIVAPKPSRLPVRSSSLQNNTDTTTTPSPPGVSLPAHAPVNPAQMYESEGEVEMEGAETETVSELEVEPGETLERPPVPFILEELGRVSPMRYVHGAPLHNVLEEGEEEDD